MSCASKQEIEAAACRRLWGEVLNLGIKDAFRVRLRLPSSGSSGASSLDQRVARNWIGSRDFKEVCLNAGVEPDFLEWRLRRLQNGPEADLRAFLRRLFGNGVNLTARPTRIQAAAARREAA